MKCMLRPLGLALVTILVGGTAGYAEDPAAVPMTIVLDTSIDVDRFEEALGLVEEIAERDLPVDLVPASVATAAIPELSSNPARALESLSSIPAAAGKAKGVVLFAVPARTKLAIAGAELAGYAAGRGLSESGPIAAVVVVTGEVNRDARVMLHELGHLLGADHADGLMAERAEDLGKATSFSEATREAIDAVLSHRAAPRAPDGFAPFTSSALTVR